MDLKGVALAASPAPAEAAPAAVATPGATMPAPPPASSGMTSRNSTGKFAPAPSTPVDAGALGKLTLRRNGALTAEAFPMGEQAVVGRFDPETGPVDIDLGRLPEAVYISRRHAEFRRDPGGGKWFLKDLGAGNGTFLRQKGQAQFQRIRGETEIADGDEIGFGNARFEFRVNGTGA
jgi:hypothetical protein